MTILDTNFNLVCSAKSDINEHAPKLKEVASKYKHITEFGVRGGISTWALLAGRPKKLISYDINKINEDNFKNAIGSENIEFIFHKQDTCSIEIEPTDVLFIDTLHSYKQLKTELTLHHSKVNHCIIMHDTFTFGTSDMVDCYNINSKYVNVSENGKGLRQAISEFLSENINWFISYETNDNNGLIILERK